MILVILAAGAGRRYGGLKQLAPLGPHGETLLEYSIYDAARAGFERAVLVVRPETEPLFRNRLDSGAGQRVALEYVHQTLETGRGKPWGTGHALLAAAERVASPFAVVNADDFYGEESFASLARFLRAADGTEPARWALVGFRLAATLSKAGPVSRAVCRVEPGGRLRELVEMHGLREEAGRIVGGGGTTSLAVSGEEPVSMNMWGFTPALFPELRQGFRDFLDRAEGDDEYLLPDAVRTVVRAGRASVRVLAGAGRWCGVTFRADEPRVAATLRSLSTRGRYPQPLWS